MSGTILLVIAYAAAAVFLAAFVLKALKIASLPVHLRWELAPVAHEGAKAKYGGSYFEEFEWWTKPREKSLLNEAVYMAKEIFLLKGVWEHNRTVWFFSFPFHLGLYVLAGLVGFLAFTVALLQIGVMPPELFGNIIWLLGFGGCALGAIGAAGLIFQRLTIPHLKNYSAPAHFVNLGLLLAVFATGIISLLVVDFCSAQLFGFMAAFLTFGTSALSPPQISGGLAIHIILACLFLAYLPFTQMTHFLAKYFTYHKVRWDDEPMKAGSDMEMEVLELLKQPVSWAAPHIKADGKKNWVDIATEEVDK